MSTTFSELPTSVDASPPWLIGWQAANTFGQMFAQAVGMQAEVQSAWLHSLQAVHSELVDEWIARWGGGVPLDG